MKIRRK